MHKQTAWRSIAAACALAVGLAATTTASAAEAPVDVTGFAVKSMVFSEAGCQNNPVTISRTVDPGVEWYSVDALVSPDGTVQSWLFFDAETSTDYVHLCGTEGLGKYTVGPTQVYGVAGETSFDYADATSKSFNVRGQGKATLSASRSGNYVTLSAKASYYKPGSDSYVSYSPKSAKFQIKTSTGWKTVKTVDFRYGKASYRIWKSYAASYRVTFPSTYKVTSAASASVRK